MPLGVIEQATGLSCVMLRVALTPHGVEAGHMVAALHIRVTQPLDAPQGASEDWPGTVMPEGLGEESLQLNHTKCGRAMYGRVVLRHKNHLHSLDSKPDRLLPNSAEMCIAEVPNPLIRLKKNLGDRVLRASVSV